MAIKGYEKRFVAQSCNTVEELNSHEGLRKKVRGLRFLAFEALVAMKGNGKLFVARSSDIMGYDL